MPSTVKMVQWWDDHYYCVETEDGQKIYIPSVTTKLAAVSKPFLARWRGDVGNREADLRMMEAADRGSRIHHAYHVFKTGGAILFQPYQRPLYTRDQINELENQYEGNIAFLFTQDEMYQLYKLQRLYEILKPKVMFSEHIVYSLETMDAGQVDDIWYLEAGEYPISREPLIIQESGLYINDLKTGNQVDDDSFMQIAAYLKLSISMGIGEFKGSLITHTNAKSKTGIEGLAVLKREIPEVEADYNDYRHVASIWERKFSTLKPKVFEFPSLITQNGTKKEVQNGNDTRTSEGMVSKKQ